MSQESLVRFLESRSQEDFDTLVRATEAQARRMASSICGDRDRAEDVVQEVYARLLRDPPPLEAVRESRSYVALRVLDIAHKHNRCEARRAAHEVRSATHRPQGAGSLSPEDTLTVREAIRALPEHLRRIVELRFYDGRTVQEVARELGLTERHVFKRLADVAKLLRTRLAGSVAAVACAALLGRSRAEAATARSSSSAVMATVSAATILLVAAGGAWLWQRAGVGVEANPVVADAGPVAPAGETSATVTRTRQGAAGPIATLPARLSLRIVDRSGAPVSSGTVEFSPSAKTDFQRGLQRVAGALGLATTIPSRALPASGQLELDLPQTLQGFAVEVKVTAPRFVGHREASFTPLPGLTAELIVTLAQAIEVTVLVRNAQSGEPVPGALVEVESDPWQVPAELAALARLTGPPGDPAGRTDPAGRILLPDVRERNLSLGVIAPGYWPARVEGVAPLELVTVWLHEKSGDRTSGSLTVRVLDPAGRPWPHAVLQLPGLPADQRSQVTDQAGILRLESLEPGLHGVTLKDPPFKATQEFLELQRTSLLYRHAAIELKPGADAEVVLRPADRTCAARFALVDASGRPCARTEVRLGEHLGELTTTDQHGLARFEGQEPGRQRIFAGRKDAWAEVGEVELASHSEVEVRCELGPGILRGKVSGEEGQPVKGASIRCESPRRIDAATDDRGRFEVRSLEPGRYELLIVPREPALAPKRLAVDVKGHGEPEDVIVALWKGGQVRILAATPDGQPLPDLRAAVKVTGVLGEQILEHHGGQRETEFRTRCPLEPGEHIILLGGPGREPHEIRVEIRPGEETVVRATLEAQAAASSTPRATPADPGSLAGGE